MKQRGGNCALISRETLTFNDRKLLPARNTALSVKCLGGHAVAQLVKALCYKLEGCGFDS
jgi:hypothetical protein